MIIYPLIRATRIASACAIVNPEYQLTVATLTEIISFALPLLNIKIPFSSYTVSYTHLTLPTKA